ncbi:hypothetical protein [Massilia sp. GCM10023247]|uniref:hypothetical protein n=1 Tax=Massilia sp. GCM10023247 TaxID=3252643 RepID=UPI00361361B3
MWAALSIDALLARQPAAPELPLSPRQRDILLNIEDPTFFSHLGFSLADGQGVATISSSPPAAGALGWRWQKPAARLRWHGFAAVQDETV